MGAGWGPHEGSVRGTVLEEALYSKGNYLDEEANDFLRNNKPAPLDRIGSIVRTPTAGSSASLMA